MSENISVAAIGSDESITIYNAVGFKTFYSNSIDDIDKKIFSFYKNGCKIIYVTEEIFTQIEETREKYSKMAYPIIIPLPLDNKNSGLGTKRIKENVEKAIGINIF